MKKVVFIMENMNGGGAERVLPNLLKYLSTDKYDITLLTLFADGVNRERVPKKIRYVCRKAPFFKGITFLVKFLSPQFLYNFLVRKVFPDEEFDVAIAYMHGIPTKVVAGAPCKKIAWLHGNFTKNTTLNFPRNFFSRTQMCACLSRIDAIVGVSKAISESFQEYTGISRSPLVIHNTNDVNEIQRLAGETSPYLKQKGVPEIVTVGHLQRVKGNDRLLQAAKWLKDEGFVFHITILGEGPERPLLEHFLQKNNMQKWGSLPGYIANPYPYIKNADLYICPSRSEGFSTAVSEAVILGIPVISTRVSGADEILGGHNEFGIVCDNSEEGIYHGLKTLLQNSVLREHYAAQSHQRAAMFTPEKTVGDVERLLDDICR